MSQRPSAFWGLWWVAIAACAGPQGAPPDFDELRDMRKPEATRQVFINLLAENPDAPPAWICELKTQIARTHSRMGEYQQAHALLDSVEPALTESMDRPRLRYLLERGRTFRLAGDIERARPLLSKLDWLARDEPERLLRIERLAAGI